MKKILLFLLICSCTFSATRAQEVWFDVNFNSEEWIDAFTTALGQDIRTMVAGDPNTDVNNNSAWIETPNGTIVNDFKFNGNFFREKFTIASEAGYDYDYAFRLRNNNETYIEFPELENAGKITVYARNQNADTDSRLNLQTKDEEGNWINEPPLIRWEIPGNNAYPTGDFMLTFNINSPNPIPLRFHRSQPRFVSIHRFIVEKYEDPNGINNSHKTSIFDIQDNTVYLSQPLKHVSLSVYDITGMQILHTMLSSFSTHLNITQSGVYIVKVESEFGTQVKKINIQ